MNEAQVLAFIQEHIIANGNNYITANILRPILEAMLAQPNDKIGELSNLETDDQSDIVAAINELVGIVSNTQISNFIGPDNPNDVPPNEGNFSTGDFYTQDFGGIQQLWQYNGITWIKIIGASDESFTATSGQTEFILQGNPNKISVYYNASRAHEGVHYTKYVNVDGNMVVTFNFPLPLNTPVVIDKS